MKRILVSNIFYRKTFDVISILSKEYPNIELILGTENTSYLTKFKTGLIYSGRTELFRTECYEDFAFDLKNISKKYSNDDIIFLPVEEQPTSFFLSFVEINGNLNFKYLLPQIDIFDLFRNKYRLNKYCLENNISAPKLFDALKIDKISKSEFPLILKPKLGSGSKGIIRLLNINQVTTDIISLLSNNSYVVQELIPNGRDVKGAFFLVQNGMVIGSYTHKRIRTSPSVGGVTVLSAVSYNEEIIKAGQDLLGSVKWNGLVMLEFLYDPNSRSYKIIEANPRLWGSIMLSEYSGANLLKNYVNICFNINIVNSTLLKEARIRWFFPVDLLNYVKAFGNIRGFWSFKNTCFINYTYSSFWSSFLFNLFSIFDIKNFKRFFNA